MDMIGPGGLGLGTICCYRDSKNGTPNLRIETLLNNLLKCHESYNIILYIV